MPNFTDKLKTNFDKTSAAIFNALQNKEEAILTLDAEESTFVRFNNCKVRQNTQVEQVEMGLHLQTAKSNTRIVFSLSGHSDKDIQTALHWLKVAREECAQLPEDPFMVPVVNNGHSNVAFTGQLLTPDQLIESLVQPAQGTDMAGLYCAGPLITANKNSHGQSHWFATENFFMDYSLYNGSKAVKAAYSGTEWNQNDFANSLSQSKNQLSLMERAKKTIPRGEYRTYLAPAAVAEILGMFAWGFLGLDDYKRGNSPVKKMAEKEKQFSNKFHLQENFKLGLTPQFNALGELAPENLSLIKNGQLENFLVSSRSAKEFSTTGNNASPSESPRSMELMPGQLAQKDILHELGTGLYLSNLHYLNWSDRQNARITGMTRYACFWVENGEIVAPIEDLRFDESLYDCFGTNLVDFTDFQETEINTLTYESRALGGKKNPGALINNFKFTL